MMLVEHVDPIPFNINLTIRALILFALCRVWVFLVNFTVVFRIARHNLRNRFKSPLLQGIVVLGLSLNLLINEIVSCLLKVHAQEVTLKVDKVLYVALQLLNEKVIYHINLSNELGNPLVHQFDRNLRWHVLFVGADKFVNLILQIIRAVALVRASKFDEVGMQSFAPHDLVDNVLQKVSIFCRLL